MKKPYVDLMDIKRLLASGDLATKINMFGSVLLENTKTSEAVQLMMLPENYSYRPKASWEPQFVYTSSNADHLMEGYDGYACSECGWTTDEKHDYCVCGADMRESNRAHKIIERFKELANAE